MGTPWGRQDSRNWENVRDWDKETSVKLSWRVAGGIRHRFPHKNCSHDNICDECKTLIENIVTATREQYEIYIGNKLSELLNIKCPFPHGGSD